MPLLEREEDLAETRNALERVARGAGEAIVVEGPPGIGKSALMAAVIEQAARRGFRRLEARGGELERDLAFGVVRDLFARPQPPVVSDERWNSGAAAPLLERAKTTSATDPGAVLHDLYWRVLDLAEAAPVLVAVDDAHWADPDSAAFLEYLSRRIADVAVMLLVSVRPGETPLPERLAEALPTAVVRPASLSTAAAAAVVRATLPDAEDVFCEACREVAGGNPFLLEQVAAELEAAGIAPVAERAREVAALVPAGVARLAVDRVRRRSEDAVQVAQAVAVLGPDAFPAAAAAVAGLEEDRVPAAVGELVRLHVLSDVLPLAFVHPLMRSAFYASLSSVERAGAHGRAWRLLADSPDALDRVARHIQLTPPAGDARVVELLSEAASRAVDDGAPAAAAAALRRALQEPPDGAQRPQLLWRLGRAEASLGLADAPARLLEARAALAPAEAMEAAAEASQALSALGRFSEAVAIADEAALQADDELALRLRSHALAAAGYIGAAVPERIAGAPRDGIPRTTAEALFLDQIAEAGWYTGMASAEQADIAARALAGPGILEAGGGRHSLWVLIMADRHDEVARYASRMLDIARTTGSEQMFAIVSASVAHAAERRGDLAEAEALAAGGYDVARRQAPDSMANIVCLTFLICALTARGRLDEAGALEAEHAALLDRLPSNALNESLRFAFARLWVERGELARGADTLVEITRRVADIGINNPAPWSTRNFAVPALMQLGRRDEALALAEEELTLARAYGAAGTIGGALRSLGIATGGADGIELLRESVATLEPTGLRLYLVRSLLELGAALRRAGRKSDAQEPLARAMGLAHEIGAERLAQLARDELSAAGARPRRVALRGVEALTASERRVAQVAAQGMTNREVAQALFVTPKTVEKHLRNAYDKLGITSRAELVTHLG